MDNDLTASLLKRKQSSKGLKRYQRSLVESTQSYRGGSLIMHQSKKTMSSIDLEW